MKAVDRIAFLIFALVTVVACSAEYQREKPAPQTATDLHRYCLSYPADSACQGPASK